jgi:dihydroorotase
MRLLIQNGYVVDPSLEMNAGKNLLLENGRVVGLMSYSDPVPDGVKIFDATRLIVAPGFIDMHVHLREPGQEYKETPPRRWRVASRRSARCRIPIRLTTMAPSLVS